MSRRLTELRGRLWPVVLLLGGIGAVLVYRSLNPPEPPLAAVERGLDAVNRGETERAESIRDRLATDPSTEMHARLLDAALLIGRHRYGRALRIVGDIPRDGELRIPATRLLGQCLYFEGRYAEAEAVILELTRETPEDITAWQWLASVYFDLGAYDWAIKALEHVLELDPENYAAHRTIGMMLKDFEFFERAVEEYRKALDLQPRRDIAMMIRMEMAECHIKQRQYDEAIGLLKNSLDVPELLTMAAECHWNLGDIASAQGYLERSQRLDPNFPPALLLQARIDLGASRAREAITALESLLEADPHNEKARYLLARAFQQLGEADKYEAHLQQWERDSKLITRLSELNKRANTDRWNVELRDELADVCRSLGKEQLAARWKKAADACRERNRRLEGASVTPTPQGSENSGG